MFASSLRPLHALVIASILCTTACGGRVLSEGESPYATGGENAGGTSSGGASSGSGATGNGVGSDAAPSVQNGTASSLNGPNMYCALAPWTNTPEKFVATDGTSDVPAGTYDLHYVQGAQIHDQTEGYEVTAHYLIDGLEAGHHIYNGQTPETSDTSIWLDDTGLVGSQGTVEDVQDANAGHTWSITTTGGPLSITYYDNDYSDNEGPGTFLCLDVPRSVTIQVPANVPWVDTGLDATAGSTVMVQASGTVQYGNLDAQVTDANGGNYDGTQVFADDVLPDVTTAALIGKIGGTTDVGTGQPLPPQAPNGSGFVGVSYSQMVFTSGRIYLGFNDQVGSFGDNSGSFTVTLTTRASL